MFVRYYVSYTLSYREIEEILAVGGFRVGHATINRWLIRFALSTEANARRLIQNLLRHGGWMKPIS